MSQVRIVNKTRHPVNVEGPDGQRRTVLPEGRAARVRYDREHVFDAFGAPVYEQVVRQVANLPSEDPYGEVMYVVGSLVAAMLPGRRDLLIPAELIREGGRVVGCRSFVMPADGVGEA